MLANRKNNDRDCYREKAKLICNTQMKRELDRCMDYDRYCWNYYIQMNNEYQANNDGKIEKSNMRIKRFRSIRNSEEWQLKLPAYIIDRVGVRFAETLHTVCAHNRKVKSGELKEPYMHIHCKSKKESRQSFEFSEDRILKNQYKKVGKNFTFGICLSENSCVKRKYRNMKITNLPRGLVDGTARIISASIFKEYGEYYVSFCMERIIPKKHNCVPKKIIGIDPGVSTTITLSNGNKLSFPKKLKDLAKKSRYYQSRMDKRYKRGSKKQSNGYYEARTKLHKVLKKIHNLKADWIHKVTTKLAKSYSVIKWEDVDSSKLMSKSSYTKKSVQESNWFTICRILKEKVEARGSKFVFVPCEYASTQRCSNCGYLKTGTEKLSLKDRVYVCPECGHVEDRDINAAKNIANYQ